MTPNSLANDEIRRGNQSRGDASGNHGSEEKNRDLPAGDPDMPTAFRSVDGGSTASDEPAKDGLTADIRMQADDDPAGLPDSLNGEGAATESSNRTASGNPDRDDTFSDTNDDVGMRPPLQHGDTGYAG